MGSGPAKDGANDLLPERALDHIPRRTRHESRDTSVLEDRRGNRVVRRGYDEATTRLRRVRASKSVPSRALLADSGFGARSLRRDPTVLSERLLGGMTQMERRLCSSESSIVHWSGSPQSPSPALPRLVRSPRGLYWPAPIAVRQPAWPTPC